MKKILCALLAVMFLACAAGAATAEKGFEAVYDLFCADEAFGEPAAVYDMVEGGDEKICLIIFLFDTENDMTQAEIIGADGQGVNHFYLWVTDYEPGARMLVSLLERYAELQAGCDEGTDFCISYTFDNGQTMTDIPTAEYAERFVSLLRTDAEDAKE